MEVMYGSPYRYLQNYRILMYGSDKSSVTVNFICTLFSLYSVKSTSNNGKYQAGTKLILC